MQEKAFTTLSCCQAVPICCCQTVTNQAFTKQHFYLSGSSRVSIIISQSFIILKIGTVKQTNL